MFEAEEKDGGYEMAASRSIQICRATLRDSYARSLNQCTNRGRSADNAKVIVTNFQNTESNYRAKIANQHHSYTIREIPKGKVRLEKNENKRTRVRYARPEKIDYAVTDIFVSLGLSSVAVVASTALYHPVIFLIVDILFLQRNAADVMNCGRRTRDWTSSSIGSTYYKSTTQADVSLYPYGEKEGMVLDICSSDKTFAGLQRRELAQHAQNQKVKHSTTPNLLKNNGRSSYIDFLVRWLVSIFPFLKYWGGSL